MSITLQWNYHYVEGGLDPDHLNRWRIDGCILIPPQGLLTKLPGEPIPSVVAQITQKGTANASFADHTNIPQFRVRVFNCIERSTLFNTGYGSTAQFFDTIEQCKTFAEDTINFTYDMLKRAERLSESNAGAEDGVYTDTPQPHTADFSTFLLVNALRNLNEAQRHNLTLSLAVRDRLFSVEEYEIADRQLGCQ